MGPVPQRPGRGTLATIVVGFTGWASWQPIANDDTCSSARAMYRRSRWCQGCHGTILPRILGASPLSAPGSTIGEEA